MAEGSKDRLARLEEAANAIVRSQRWRLLRRYGDGRSCVDGWAYHNLTHAADVAARGAEGATELVARGVLPPQAPALAMIAGAFHDDIQFDEHAAQEYPAVAVPTVSRDSGPAAVQLSPQREELSATVALKAMRDYEIQRGEEIFSESDRAMVKEMIEATKVLHGTPTGLVQNTSADQPAGALMADADLSSLGRHDYARQALGLHFENEWLQGLHVAPAYGDIRQWKPPDRGRTVEFMSKQHGLVGGHGYLLEQSRRMFPHQALNAERMGGMRDDYAAGRLSWQGAVDRAGEWARAERPRQVRGVRPGRPRLRPEPHLGGGAVRIASRDTGRTR